MPSPFLRHGLVGGVASGGDTFSFLQERGETGVRVYQEDVLQGVVKQLNRPFQQLGMGLPAGISSCPKAKTTQEWLRRNFRLFINAEDWPSGSPDLNPRDYKLWPVLEDIACQKSHNNVDSLQRSLMKAATENPLEKARAAIAEWTECLKACVGAEGSHFQWHYYK